MARKRRNKSNQNQQRQSWQQGLQPGAEAVAIARDEAENPKWVYVDLTLNEGEPEEETLTLKMYRNPMDGDWRILPLISRMNKMNPRERERAGIDILIEFVPLLMAPGLWDDIKDRGLSGSDLQTIMERWESAVAPKDWQA